MSTSKCLDACCHSDVGEGIVLPYPLVVHNAPKVGFLAHVSKVLTRIFVGLYLKTLYS
jgi:hypothetical protein